MIEPEPPGPAHRHRAQGGPNPQGRARSGPRPDLIEDLRIDSLDLFAVLIAVQDRFNLEIDVEDMPDLNRLGDLAEYVAARRNAAAA